MACSFKSTSKEPQNKEYKEDDFNISVKDQDDILSKKFAHYSNFCREKLEKSNFNLFVFSELLIPEISVFRLNSAVPVLW
jgi:hypothetical protein